MDFFSLEHFFGIHINVIEKQSNLKRKLINLPDTFYVLNAKVFTYQFGFPPTEIICRRNVSRKRNGETEVYYAEFRRYFAETKWLFCQNEIVISPKFCLNEMDLLSYFAEILSRFGCRVM